MIPGRGREPPWVHAHEDQRSHPSALRRRPPRRHHRGPRRGDELPYVSFIIHVGFAIALAIIYCEIAEVTPLITIAQGAVFGIVVWFAFHVVIMPAMGVVPAPWNQPFAEHVSEFFGHALWMWVIEIFRRDLRNRITHQPDPWVPLPADR